MDPVMARTAGGDTARRALRVLEAVASGPGGCGVGELSEATGLNRSMTYRLTRTLLEEGYLERADDGYAVGPRLIGLAAAALPQLGSYAAARPLMSALAARSRETVTLHRRVGDVMILVLSEQSAEYELRHVPRVGEAVPLVRGCAAHAVLAYLPAAERSEITERAGASGLDAELRDARERGWAFSDRANHEAIAGVAAPVSLPSDGTHAHSLCISGPAHRLTPQAAAKLAPMLIDTCDRLADVLTVTR